jgi:Fe-S cluster assembly ATP-binding protein
LDEIDSGLDIDALKIAAKAIKLLKQRQPEVGIILITHYQRILNYIDDQMVKSVCSKNDLVKSKNIELVTS